MHVVFTTRFRHKVFEDRHLRRMEELLRQVCQDFECELVEFNAESEHVHLLVNFPPKVAISKLVNSLKGVSSRMLRQEFRTAPSLLASPAAVERFLFRGLGRWGISRCLAPLHRGSGEARIVMFRHGRRFTPALKDGAHSPTRLVNDDQFLGAAREGPVILGRERRGK